MANAVFPKYKQALLTESAASKSLDQSTANVAPWAALIDTGVYTYNAAHEFYSSLSGIVGTDQQITTPTVALGLFDGDNLVFPAVTGNSIEAVVVYRKNAGANTTWRLVLYDDTSITGAPVTPNSGDINVTWNASGIMQL